MSEESTKAVDSRIAELKNVVRMIQNTLNLINDVEIKGAYAGPVAEIQGWLMGFKASVDTQVQALESALPKKEPVIVPEVVK